MIREKKLELIYEDMIGKPHEINEIHDSTYDKTFKLGGEYHLGDGNLYTVNKISNLPPILYITISSGAYSGKSREVKVEQAAKWEHQYEQSTSYKFSTIEMAGDNFFNLMGVIAEHGRIEISTPEKFRGDVERQYLHVTGRDLNDSLDGPYQVLSAEKNRWYPGAKASVPLRFENTIKALEVPDIVYTKAPTVLNISNTKYIWTLIRNHKFLVGRNNSRINMIEQTIPIPNRDAFDIGVSS